MKILLGFIWQTRRKKTRENENDCERLHIAGKLACFTFLLLFFTQKLIPFSFHLAVKPSVFIYPNFHACPRTEQETQWEWKVCSPVPVFPIRNTFLLGRDRIKGSREKGQRRSQLERRNLKRQAVIHGITTECCIWYCYYRCTHLWNN